jgi:hypothetical protein
LSACSCRRSLVPVGEAFRVVAPDVTAFAQRHAPDGSSQTKQLASLAVVPPALHYQGLVETDLRWQSRKWLRGPLDAAETFVGGAGAASVAPLRPRHRWADAITPSCSCLRGWAYGRAKSRDSTWMTSIG